MKISDWVWSFEEPTTTCLWPSCVFTFKRILTKIPTHPCNKTSPLVSLQFCWRKDLCWFKIYNYCLRFWATFTKDYQLTNIDSSENKSGSEFSLYGSKQLTNIDSYENKSGSEFGLYGSKQLTNIDSYENKSGSEFGLFGRNQLTNIDSCGNKSDSKFSLYGPNQLTNIDSCG